MLIVRIKGENAVRWDSYAWATSFDLPARLFARHTSRGHVEERTDYRTTMAAHRRDRRTTYPDEGEVKSYRSIRYVSFYGIPQLVRGEDTEGD